MFVERWYERLEDGTLGGGGARGRNASRAAADRSAIKEVRVLEDLLPAGLEPVDLSLRTSGTLGPFVRSPVAPPIAGRRDLANGPLWQSVFYGSWDSGWWSPWEYKELRDDRVIYFARELWTGTYTTSYIARATTPGRFIRPPAHAEEMYNPAVRGRSEGGIFVVVR